MKEKQNLGYLKEATDAVLKALKSGQKFIVVRIPMGYGKSSVLKESVKLLQMFSFEKIVVLTREIGQAKQIDNLLRANNDDSISTMKNIICMTYDSLLSYDDVDLYNYDSYIFVDVILTKENYNRLKKLKKSVVVLESSPFLTNNVDVDKKETLYTSKEVVYSYTYQQAIKDGNLTPAMDSTTLRFAAEFFIIELMKYLGFLCDDGFCKKDGIKLYIESKRYKSQILPPTLVNEMIKTIVFQNSRLKINGKDEYILLIVFNKLKTIEKDEIFKRHKMIIWDIENLVYYCKNNSELLKRLSQITYYPIDNIDGECSKEMDNLKLLSDLREIEEHYETISAISTHEEENKIKELIFRLKNCDCGRDGAAEYEMICEEIVRNLFETSFFNKLTSQHKTEDEHFRMDLIGALKKSQNNDETLHPLWQMLVEHYHTHFVVFEFKNYAKEIDQNLIYITEKYLFDAALRNVAFIISRKGFSKSAKFAAKGCLKEHGKLILDINDDDLYKMLEYKGEKAADYLLDKLEDFLMSISK